MRIPTILPFTSDKQYPKLVDPFCNIVHHYTGVKKLTLDWCAITHSSSLWLVFPTSVPHCAEQPDYAVPEMYWELGTPHYKGQECWLPLGVHELQQQG